MEGATRPAPCPSAPGQDGESEYGAEGRRPRPRGARAAERGESGEESWAASAVGVQPAVPPPAIMMVPKAEVDARSRCRPALAGPSPRTSWKSSERTSTLPKKPRLHPERRRGHGRVVGEEPRAGSELPAARGRASGGGGAGDRGRDGRRGRTGREASESPTAPPSSIQRPVDRPRARGGGRGCRAGSTPEGSGERQQIPIATATSERHVDGRCCASRMRRPGRLHSRGAVRKPRQRR